MDSINEIIIYDAMEIEAVAGEIVMHFDLRDADEPGTAERALDAFEGATVSVEKEVAAGKVRLRIRGADATPGIDW